MADAVPIPEVDETDSAPPDPDELRRRAIPMSSAPAIQPRAATPIPPVAAAPQPAAPAIPAPVSRAIPAAAVSSPAAPMTATPIPGSQQDLDARAAAIHQGFEHPKSAPIQTGVASLWTKAQNIHNPVLRVLGEIGAGGARALDAAGQAVGRVVPAVGAVESAIPGSTMNEEFKQRQENKQEAREAGLEEKQAAIEHTKAETGAIPAHVKLEEAQAAAAGAKEPNPDQQALDAYARIGTPQELPEDKQVAAAYEKVQQAKQEAKPTPAGDQPLGDKVAPMNQALAQRYQVLNPGKPLPPQYTVPPNATRADYEMIDKALEAEERARGTKEQQDTTNAMRAQTAAFAQQAREDAKGSKVDARSDKSYSYNNDKLDKLGKPIEDAQARMGRLQDTLAQGTPQADALIAPELLTIMAGGAGSGLRMNEAEIARIVGGRSKWESLQAAANQWRLDPTKANTITPEQRKEIHALVGAVNVKLQAKQQALDSARENLLNSDDPKDHRRIVTDAHHALTQVDEQAGGAEGQFSVKAPNGKTYNFKDQKSVDNFKKEAGIK
jgi:hypothetical protein